MLSQRHAEPAYDKYDSKKSNLFDHDSSVKDLLVSPWSNPHARYPF
jgi:hypothetical protein